MIKTIADVPALQEEAATFVRSLTPRLGATLVTLTGELGAGKTAFVKAAAQALGVEGVVNSPTFVLEKVYALPKGALFNKLIHIDAYRLENGADLAPLRFEELMQDAGNLIFLEWPERVSGALPPPAVAISIQTLSGGEREIFYGDTK